MSNLPASTQRSVWLRLRSRLRGTWLEGVNRWRLWQLGRQITLHTGRQPGGDGLQPPRPVAFFNTTTRLAGISQNAAFSLLAATALQSAGVPVVHFACQAGLSRCVLASAQGVEHGNPTAPPPCKTCMATSSYLLSTAPVVPFTYRADPQLAAILQPLTVAQLGQFEYPLAADPHAVPPPLPQIPLGALVLPSLRWTLRRHHLQDDEPTRFLFREYILSAYHLAGEFKAFLDRVEPQAVVVFNGVMYPEGTARWVAQQRGLRVISHEVGHSPFSAFFTEGNATAYPVEIPEEFELSPEQEKHLDDYLEKRFQGKFSMAGIRFWPELKGLDASFLQRAAGFKQIVPVFTNVIFDTSQIHANVLFEHMFAWLDLVHELARSHPQTLFVIRAHPDEQRPGKSSRESVADWVQQSRVLGLPNVVFVASNEYISSYELIQRSKFVMVYNSTIGLEAALMGAAVLCGGKSRYTQIPTVFLPASAAEYRRQAEAFLAAEAIEVPAEFRRNARRYLYYTQYLSALPFGDFLQPHENAGFVVLKPISWQKLASRENSSPLRVLVEGILHGKPFVMPK